MLSWLAETIVEQIVVLVLGLVIGYLIHSQRSRVKVSLSTHIEQSWSDRSIHMSIRNHGNTSVVVDSWTVHVPLRDLFPQLSEGVEEREIEQGKRLKSLRRVAGWIGHRIWKRNEIARFSELSESLAHGFLGEVHLRHQLLDPGATVRIGPGESEVRNFPREGAVSWKPPNASNAESLTIIPSCHVVGHRRRIWGWVSIIADGGETIPIAMQWNPPDAEDGG